MQQAAVLIAERAKFVTAVQVPPAVRLLQRSAVRGFVLTVTAALAVAGQEP